MTGKIGYSKSFDLGRCFCGFWPCLQHDEQDRKDHAKRERQKELYGRVLGTGDGLE